MGNHLYLLIKAAVGLLMVSCFLDKVSAGTLTITSANGNQLQVVDSDGYVYNNQMFISPSLHTFSITANASTGWHIYQMLYWTQDAVWLGFGLPDPAGSHTTWNFNYTYDFNYLRPTYATEARFATYRNDASGTSDIEEAVDIPLKVSSDIDNDGIADWWELKFFGTLGYGGGDNYNGDYLTNGEEYYLGLNPTLYPGDCHTTSTVGLQVFTLMQ
ncbi:MAG: hypothetical protein QM796_10825 [Chthoniobacteraceae bacterium]